MARVTEAPARARHGRTRVVLLAAFAVFGVSIGAKGVLWADLMAALRLGEATFGTAQLVPPLVAVGLMLLGGPLCAAAGARRLTIAGFGLLAASSLGLASAGGVGGFVAALAVDGLSLGLLETAVNSAALDWEGASGRPGMNLMHAGFSAGAVGGALAAGGLLALGYPYGLALAALALLSALLIGAVTRVSFPAAASRPDATTPGAALRLALGRRPLVVLALIGALGVVGESVANTWSVVYLRGLGAPVLVGGSAFALFNGAMLAGRLANAPVVARLGARASLMASGMAMLLAGLLLVPSSVPLAVASFLLLGLGAAGILPTVLGVAAEHAPGGSGAVAGGILAAAYVGFILCPPLVGWVAELASLQAALLAVGVAGLAIVALSRGAAWVPALDSPPRIGFQP